MLLVDAMAQGRTPTDFLPPSPDPAGLSLLPS
jgi:hypothetical protein